MPSTLRQLQTEWNTLVPAAQARGIAVRHINTVHETVARGQARVAWLREQLGSTASLTQLTFGVEIELIMPAGMTREDLASRIATHGVECHAEVYNHSVTQGWKIVSDGSLGDYHRGAEVVSPVLRGEDGFRQVRQVCAVLVEVGCQVNRRCGFHVHVGCRNEGLQFFKNLVRLYVHTQDALDTVMSPSRRGHHNSYCQPVYTRGDLDGARTLEDLAEVVGHTPHNPRSSCRYKKLNLQSFWQHGTVEFRHHQGTVEAAKVENWVRLCLRMVQAAQSKAPTERQTLDGLMTFVEASAGERQYFSSRAQALS